MIKKIFITVAILACAPLLKAQDSLDIEVVKFDYLQRVFNQKNDTTYIVNFWATWCKPCIKELPYFNQLQTRYAGKKIKVLLVSLDFKKSYQASLLPYIKKHNINTPVVLLDEPDANAWIDRVDPSWSGAIPATVIFNSQQRQFFEKEFNEEELYNLVESFIGS